MDEMETVQRSGAGRAPIAVVGSSELAREVRRLRSSQRFGLQVPDEAVLLWDVIVSCAAVVIDDSDERPWQVRLGELIEGLEFFTDMGTEEAEKAAAYVKTFATSDLPEWAQKLKQDGSRRFLIRMLGAGTYRRCALAMQQDGAVIAAAIRKLSRRAMPHAVALDDLYAALPEVKMEELKQAIGGKSSLLALAVSLDQILEKKSDEWGLALTEAAADVADLDQLTVGDLSEIAVRLRSLVQNSSREAVEGLSGALARKMAGARQALEHSDDGVAQAANSLVELVDRVLRAAFPDEFVLNWLGRNYSDAEDVKYAKDGGPIKPTKRGQALCFAHAGQDVEQRSPLHELAAAAIVAARSKLQQLKHADEGTVDEMVEVGKYMAALEGYMSLVIGVVWSNAPTERLDRFKRRLEKRKAA